MEKKEKFICDGIAPIRLDRYLSQILPTMSRSRVQGLIKSGNVSVDQEITTKNSTVLDKNGQIISVSIPEPEPLDITAEKLPLNIIFENNDIIVVNKSAGMVMHPSAGHLSGTLVNAALGYTEFVAGIGGKMRPGIVHRLDKDTSGVVLVAKNDQAHHWLQKQFKDRNTEKHYIALVDKHPATQKGKIDAPIYRDPNNRKKMAVAPFGKGKEAVTIFHTKQVLGKHSLLDIQILTGRTHQIRVHLASIGTPVTGDTVYGYATPTISINRQFLHAASLGICLPGQDHKTFFKADLPDELINIINDLKAKGV